MSHKQHDLQELLEFGGSCDAVFELISVGRAERMHSSQDKPGDPRLYVCQAPNAFMCVTVWGHLGSILGPFWVPIGSNLFF